jgi:hypothetical protein
MVPKARCTRDCASDVISKAGILAVVPSLRKANADGANTYKESAGEAADAIQFFARLVLSMNTDIASAGFHAGFAPAITQMLAARLTRMALALELMTPLTPYPDVEDELSRLDRDELYFNESRPCVPAASATPVGAFGTATA